jgi:hypothetical protein
MSNRRPLSSSIWSGSSATIVFLVALALLVLLTMRLPEGTDRQKSTGASHRHGHSAAVAR